MTVKWFIFLMILFGLFFFSISFEKTNAQMMMSMGDNVSQEIYNHTVEEELEGQAIYSNLIKGQVDANQFTNDDLGKIGEYFMGRMIGNTLRHARMNQMMTNMMGKNGEEAIHINMGRRYVNPYLSSQNRSINTINSYGMGGCM